MFDLIMITIYALAVFYFAIDAVFGKKGENWFRFTYGESVIFRLVLLALGLLFMIIGKVA